MNLEMAEKMLDVAAVGVMLRSSPLLGGRGVDSVVLENTWIKPGRYFNAHYTVQMSDGGAMAPSLFLLDRKRARHIVAGADPATTTALMPEILLQIFPLDYRLPTLQRCLDVAQVRHFLPTLDAISCEVKAYRPGIRCQLRYETAARTAVYGKVAVESRGVGYLFHTQTGLRSALAERGSTLRLPRPCAYSVDLGLTVLEEVAGTSLYESIRAGTATVDDIRGAARILRELHDLPPLLTERSFTADDEIALTESWAALAGEMRPEITASLAAATALLRGRKPRMSDVPTVIHRDFYDKQILLDAESGPALLDMDTASLGDPELDVGNFCAQLRLRSAQFGEHDSWQELEDAFLDGYRGHLVPERTDWYRRASLVRLACNYSLRPHWRHIAPALTHMALED